MGYRIQNRRDTAARWAEINPILLEGEIGYVIDNPNQYKIGDGVSAWNNLPLRGFNGTIAPTLGYNDDAVPSQRVITERFDSQSEKLSELGQEDIPFFVIKDEYVSKGDGSVLDYIGWDRTTFVRVSQFSKIKIYIGEGSRTDYVCLYDKSKNFVKSISIYTEIDLDIPENVSFLIFSSYREQFQNLRIEVVEYRYTTISKEVTENKEKLNMEFGNNTIYAPEVSKLDSYIEHSSLAIKNAEGYIITKPLFLNKNDEVKANLFGAKVVLLAECDEEGNLTRQIFPESLQIGQQDFTYKANKDMNVVFCYSPKHSSSIEINRIGNTNAKLNEVKDEVNDLSESTKDLKDKVNGVTTIINYSVKMNGYIETGTLAEKEYATYRISNPFYVHKGDNIVISDICGNGVALLAECTEDGSSYLRELIEGTQGGVLETHEYIADKDMYLAMSYSGLKGIPVVYLIISKGLQKQIDDVNEKVDDVNDRIDDVNERINSLTSLKSDYTTEFASIKTPLLYGAVKDNTYSPLSLLWCTDTHGFIKGLNYFVEIWDKYKSYIDDAILTGDKSPQKWSSYNEAAHESVPSYLNILKQIGNHDVFDYLNQATDNGHNYGDSNYFAPDGAKYMRYFKNIENWGVVQPNGVNDSSSPFYCACYYYKDYTSCNVRLVMLDCMAWTNYQHSWFVEVLNDAKSKGIHVICSQHIPLGGASGLDGFDSAWNSNAYVAKGENWNNEILDDVDTFINSGGNFVCWLHGHMHIDLVGTYNGHPKQAYICMATSAAPNGAWDELARPVGTESEFVVNVLGVDYKSRTIKLYRIGARLDKNLQKREVLCIDYSDVPAVKFEY